VNCADKIKHKFVNGTRNANVLIFHSPLAEFQTSVCQKRALEIPTNTLSIEFK